ncbi:MAG: threonine--tRNA ligase [bacterium]|nr:threonine--tRNA ligase [bacterium]
MTEQKEDHLYNLRHSAAHMLAAAALKLFPGTKLGTGPVTDNGFYYDLLFPEPITEDDLKKLEKQMKKTMSGGHDFVRKSVSKKEALDFFSDQPFKQELIEKFSGEGRDLTLYESGPITDLCEGGHVDNSKELNPKAFKLVNLAGAYWQADESNAQMTRVYGVLFETKEELDAHFELLAEAKKRDHRILGRELELFTIIDDIGPGLPLYYPKGALIHRLIKDYIEDAQRKLDFEEIYIPHIAKSTLYETSGHLGKYDAMFPPIKLDDVDYYLKPMNCPHFMMLYKSQLHSYRDLPMRWTATSSVYRNEKSGEVSGLTRVRGLLMDDCHVFMRPDQIEQEFDVLLELISNVYEVFGLTEFWVSVSTRDKNDLDKYLGDEKVWDAAEKTLEAVVAKNKMNYKVIEGEAAFYGPKLDFMVKDAIGREWQLSTLQLDFNLPERFDLEYVDDKGEKVRPVVVHRAVLGSVDRWMGLMIEHFAGAFPLWLAPVQVEIIPVGEGHVDYCMELAKEFKAVGVRVMVSDESETVGNKIRKSVQQKVPYMLVVGDKEMESSNLSVRKRGEQDLIETKKSEFIANVIERDTNKSLEL